MEPQTLMQRWDTNSGIRFSVSRDKCSLESAVAEHATGTDHKPYGEAYAVRIDATTRAGKCLARRLETEGTVFLGDESDLHNAVERVK